MGGTVTMVIRRSNGDLWHNGVWTNSMNNHILHPRFLAEEEEYVRHYQDEWDGADWYGKHEHLSPREYGMVVVDFMNKKILSMQDYSSPGFITSVCAGLDTGVQWEDMELTKLFIPDLQDLIREDKDPYFMSYLQLFMHYAMKGLISYKNVYGNEFPEIPVFENEEHCYRWFLDHFVLPTFEGRNPNTITRSLATFEIDLSPWEVEIFGYDRDRSSSELLDAVRELGIEVEGKDLEEWNKYISDQESD